MFSLLEQAFSVIDLTHPIDSGMPHWPGDPPTQLQAVADLLHHGYLLHRLQIGEHSGTHIGAPVHSLADGISVEGIPADRLVLPAFFIVCRAACRDDRDFLLQPQEVRRWEQANAPLGENALLLVATGWSDYWRDSRAYLGQTGNEGLHFPGVAVETAQFLLQERKIAALGIDTAGIDGGASTTYAVNHLLAENGAYHLENLTHLHRVPATGAWVVVGALPLRGGSGSPCRVLALVSPDTSCGAHT
ncbi:cyclase family protein [candidate division KSB1 bacterium]|nr:cyclase family protein [candidate division KSB1 bacterium]